MTRSLAICRKNLKPKLTLPHPKQTVPKRTNGSQILTVKIMLSQTFLAWIRSPLRSKMMTKCQKLNPNSAFQIPSLTRNKTRFSRTFWTLKMLMWTPIQRKEMRRFATCASTLSLALTSLSPERLALAKIPSQIPPCCFPLTTISQITSITFSSVLPWPTLKHSRMSKNALISNKHVWIRNLAISLLLKTKL